MPDQVDYQFVNGWVATGDFPCRQALRAMLGERHIDLPDRPFAHIYSGAETDRVDLSDFCHRPTLKSCFARCQIMLPDAQDLEFEIETCGGVLVWLDNDLTHEFEPFERNIPNQSKFSRQLAAGAHMLTVRFEDLCERDASFGFKLKLLQGENITVAIRGIADTAQLRKATALLEGLRMKDVFHFSNRAVLTSDNLSDIAVHLSCRDLPGQEGMMSLSSPELSLTLPAGCPLLAFETEIDGIRISRSIGTTVMPGADRLSSKTLTARKTDFLSKLDRVEHIEACLFALSAGCWNEEAEREFLDAIKRVEERWDCADFRMMSLLWIWARYRNALPSTHADRLQHAILGFRYWMDEPGNDVMWFWSENHVLCFHVAQHLAGQMMPSAVFGNSGKFGHEQECLGRERLHKWFDSIEKHGLAEWNSAAYYPINYRGLLTLFELTDDLSLRQRAKALLDQISAMVALHQCGGVATGSQGRIYEKELLAGPMTELGAVASVLFGGWHVPGKDAAAILVALSDYTPSKRLIAFAWPEPGTMIEARYAQGLEMANIKLLKDAHVQLSCVTHYKPGQSGHQEHVAEIQFSDHPLAKVWCNHPGDLKIWGASRPSYWAGNGRMPDIDHDATIARLCYDLQPGDIPFVHAFIPDQILDEIIPDGQWIFFRCGSGYGALWGSSPFTRLESGQYQGTEWRLAGSRLGCALVVGSSDMHTSFSAFQKRCRKTPLEWDPATGYSLGNISNDTSNFPDEPVMEPMVSLSGATAIPCTKFLGKDYE